MQKLRTLLLLFRRLRQNFLSPLCHGFDRTTFGPVKDRNRHAITDATRFALAWKQAESNGRVIGFVISLPALMPQVAHYK
jgi:hypothetical protein